MLESLSTPRFAETFCISWPFTCKVRGNMETFLLNYGVPPLGLINRRTYSQHNEPLHFQRGSALEHEFCLDPPSLPHHFENTRPIVFTVVLDSYLLIPTADDQNSTHPPRLHPKNDNGTIEIPFEGTPDWQCNPGALEL